MILRATAPYRLKMDYSVWKKGDVAVGNRSDDGGIVMAQHPLLPEAGKACDLVWENIPFEKLEEVAP